MSVNSSIEWTDTTWNPVRGCSKVSAGCKHCYAERFAERFRNVPGHPFQQGFDLKLVPEKLSSPLKWKESRMVFVNSMSDLFHDKVPLSYVEQVASVMRLASWHTYQILTKRSERMRELLNGPLKLAAQESHIWWGVSVENKKYGFPRMVDLKASQAAIRFLSIEPLLEDLGQIELEGISWVIVGGESGPGARPMKEEWVLGIQEQCSKAGVPFFFKQWGGVRKKTHGRELLGKTHDAFPTRASKPAMPMHWRIQQATRLENTSLIQLN